MKFEIDIYSPDGEFTKEEIESALLWLCNHDGKAIRAMWQVKELGENKDESKLIVSKM